MVVFALEERRIDGVEGGEGVNGSAHFADDFLDGVFVDRAGDVSDCGLNELVPLGVIGVLHNRFLVDERLNLLLRFA